MRQIRPMFTNVFKKEDVKVVTPKAYLFKFRNGEEQWVPKKWIKKFNKTTMEISDYWTPEMRIKGFQQK
jgi:hypothetical protein